MRLCFLLLALTQVPTARALNVFACEPEWGALVQELAGDTVTVYVATSSAQDPHFIEARPSLITEIRKSGLLVCTGADLEAGWLPLLLRRSGNPGIQAGQAGHFMAAEHVRRLEVPASLDRSQGDVHPQGNPHVHLDPHNLRRIARALATTLGQVDPGNATSIEVRLADFENRWREATRRWENRAAPLRGLNVISHHRSFSYLAHWLGLNVVANIEPKPGIPPSSAHLARLLEQFESSKPAVIIRTPYTEEKPSRWLSERLSVPAMALPYTVNDSDAPDLFAVFDTTIEQLLEAL